MEKIHDPLGIKKHEEKCPACEALRKGLNWVGDPPKCIKHRKPPKVERCW